MSRSTRKAGAFAAGLTALALTLTACASDGGDDGEGASPEDSVFVYAVGSNPAHLNPQLSTDVTTTLVTSPIFDTLIRIDKDTELHPGLASEWEANEDATEFTLELEEDVMWHDGEPFTSADVKFNLEEVIPLHPLGSFSKNIAEVTTPDDYTVEITLTQPFAPFIPALSGHKMLPAHVYEGTDIVTNDANMAPIGTGPFTFKEFIAGDRIVVERNDDYWDDSGNLQTVVFKIMPDSNARILAVQSGEVDRLTSTFLDAAQLPTLEKNEDLYFSEGGNQPGVMTLFFNTREGPLADADVRKALYMAIDRQAVSDNVLNGLATVARGPIPASIVWAVDTDVDYSEMFAYDPDAAGELLDEAGYPANADGTRFSLRISAASGLPTFVGTAEVVKSNLEAIGIPVSLESEDLSIFVDKTFAKHDFDMAIMSFGAYQDPSLGVSRLYVCNPNNVAFANPTGVCDPEIDKAFADAGKVSDRDKRAEYFSAAETRAAEILGTLPLVVDASVNAMRQDRWDGIEAFDEYMFENWAALSVKD